MIVVKQLYQLIRLKIMGDATKPGKNGVRVIKHFDWWNDNVVNDGIQRPFPTPAVFFELNFISWSPSTKGAVKNKATLSPEQQGIGEFTLHIVHKKTQTAAVDAAEVSHLDHVEWVFRQIHFSGAKERFLQGPIQRVRDEAVLTHTVLRDWPVVFSINLFEPALEDTTLAQVVPWKAYLTTEI